MYEQEKGNMTDYTDIIEKFLRGQMSQHEENDFKAGLESNKDMRFQACSIAALIKYWEYSNKKCK